MGQIKNIKLHIVTDIKTRENNIKNNNITKSEKASVRLKYTEPPSSELLVN